MRTLEDEVRELKKEEFQVLRYFCSTFVPVSKYFCTSKLLACLKDEVKELKSQEFKVSVLVLVC